MKIFGSDITLQPADTRNFTGTARVKHLPVVEGAQPTVVYLVQFEAAARTNWHAHSGPQVLLIREGRCLIQKWGKPVRSVAAGEAVTIDAGEKHWHGAAPEGAMSHFAVNLNFT